MEVVLLKTVPDLGQAGETKNVAAGYAKNYLFPKGLAVLPKDPLAKKIHAEIKRTAAGKQQEKATIVAKVGEWDGKSIELNGKASPDGTMYAAITHRDVAKQLGIDAKRVKFESVKMAGSYEAQIDLGSGNCATVKVNVMTNS